MKLDSYLEVENISKVVIHRPYFLLWLGYFSKLVYADKFVITDNDVFTKRHFLDRAQIVGSNGNIIWLSLKTGENYNKRCNEIEFDINLIEKIQATISHSYARSRYFKEYKALIFNLLNENAIKTNNLSNYNILLTKEIMELLNLKMPSTVLNSDLNNSFLGTTDRLLDICKKTSCNEIIMGTGGSLDIHDLSLMEHSGIDIYVQDYYNNHPEYYQCRRQRIGFKKGLSVLDCLFNEGAEKTKELIMSEDNKPVLYNRIKGETR